MNDTRVIQACRSGDLDALKVLITHDNVNTPIVDWSYITEHLTPLELCSFNGRFHCVKWLVETMKADFGTSLNEALLDGHQGCIEYLLASGADINKKDIFGKTAIYRADCYYSKKLLDLGADVNVITNDGYTILAKKINLLYMYGNDNSYIDLIKLLILYGARIKDVKLDATSSTIPVWICEYENECRQKERAIGIAFLCVCHKKRVPKDLARDVAKRMIFRQNKRSKNE